MENRRPARMIVRRLERYRHAAVWGFTLPYKQMVVGFDKIAPPNITESERSDLMWVHVDNLLGRLHTKCNEVWYSAISGPEEVYTKKDRYGEELIYVIVKSTRRNDDFIPPPEKVAELKKIFADEGFTDEPTWFRTVD